MEAQTYSVLEATGSREAVSLLLEILERPASIEELAERAGVSKTTASRRLKELALAGVLSRTRPRDPYQLTCAEPSRQFLLAASELARAILQAREEAERTLDRRVRKTRLRSQEGEVATD